MTSIANPFSALLIEADGDPQRIRAAYEKHREDRAAQQRNIFLSSEFEGVTRDSVLSKMLQVDEEDREGMDERNGIVFSAKPPERVKRVIQEVQEKLQMNFKGLWSTPPDQLHLTVLEITHSQPPSCLPPILSLLKPVTQSIVDYPYSHRTRLDRPKITFDKSAIAISFLPSLNVAGEVGTYHHLRRNVWDIANGGGVPLGARYTVPSAHITIARFVEGVGTKSESESREEAKKQVAIIDELNRGLEERKIEWDVGEGQGLDLRVGANWYGGGETLAVGKGY